MRRILPIIALLLFLPCTVMATTLSVQQGGTGSTTLTGLLKGNGLSSITTAVAGTDYQLPITLTTTGSSGAATFNGTTLNIPQYSGGGGSSGISTTSPWNAGALVAVVSNSTVQSIASSSLDLPNSALQNSTISGVSLGNNLANLSDGTGISGGTYNGSGAITITNSGVISASCSSGIYCSGSNPLSISGLSTTSPFTANAFVYTNNSGSLTTAASSSLDLPNSALQNSTISGVSLGGVLNSVTFNNGGAGAASGQTYNGSTASTISYNTLGALGSTFYGWQETDLALTPTTTLGIIINASSTINAYNSVNGTTTNATSTNIDVSGTFTNGSGNGLALETSGKFSTYGGSNPCTGTQAALSLSSTGVISCTGNLDTFSYPFTATSYGESTSTIINFTAGLMSPASTTIGTLNLQNALSIANGGTGQITANAAFNALSPMTTLGDMIYGGTSGVATRLAAGTPGYILAMSGGIPTWVASSTGTFTTGTSPPVNYASTTTLPSYTEVAGVITAVANGALYIDGNNPSVGQTILVKNETGGCTTSSGACNNGIYTVTAAGSAIATFVLTRAPYYNSSNNVYPGIATYVISGATLNDDWWALTTAAPITVGTGGNGSALTYTETSATASGVASLAQTYGSAQTGTITLATSSAATDNGLSSWFNITNSGTAFTFTPQLTGTLGVGGGGTGDSTLTVSQLLYGNGTSAVSSVATTSQTLSSAFSDSGSLGALVGGSSGTLHSVFNASLTLLGTTSAGTITGTTTIPLETSYGETWNYVRCTVQPNGATLDVQFYWNTNAGTTLLTPATIVASSTNGIMTFTANNILTSGATTSVAIGTPANSPTSINCSVNMTN